MEPFCPISLQIYLGLWVLSASLRVVQLGSRNHILVFESMHEQRPCPLNQLKEMENNKSWVILNSLLSLFAPGNVIMRSWQHTHDPKPLRQDSLPNPGETATISSSFLAVWQILCLIFFALSRPRRITIDLYSVQGQNKCWIPVQERVLLPKLGLESQNQRETPTCCDVGGEGIQQPTCDGKQP